MTNAAPRRSLVLTSESARHPFRASLPPHVLATRALPGALASGWRMSRRDWRDVLGTYCAGFIVVATFIS